MTQAKAQTVASALINAGYAVRVFKKADDTWTVLASGDAIPAATVANFATNNAVVGTVDEAKFE